MNEKLDLVNTFRFTPTETFQHTPYSYHQATEPRLARSFRKCLRVMLNVIQKNEMRRKIEKVRESPKPLDVSNQLKLNVSDYFWTHSRTKQMKQVKRNQRTRQEPC